jgi:hypothetical protein
MRKGRKTSQYLKRNHQPEEPEMEIVAITNHLARRKKNRRRFSARLMDRLHANDWTDHHDEPRPMAVPRRPQHSVGGKMGSPIRTETTRISTAQAPL